MEFGKAENRYRKSLANCDHSSRCVVKNRKFYLHRNVFETGKEEASRTVPTDLWYGNERYLYLDVR